MHIEKEQLVNLAYSLQREYLATNALGSYAQSTLANCATRKYHGLLVVQQPQIDHEWHVLLHSIDETIVQKDYEFNLALRRYEGGNYEPRGHKYLVDFTSVPVPTFTYRVADCIIKKEIVLANDENRVLIRYTVLDAPQPLTLILRPFLSFRGRHGLSAANTYINKKYTACDNGATWQLYEKYDELHLQTSRKADYTPVPDWYYNVEYTREIERGYAATEDLFAPGAFEVSLKKGDVLVVAAGTTEAKSSNLKKQFEQALARFPKAVDTPQAALQRAANQFIIATPTEANIVAGYPWFGTWGRDTFVSTAGLLTATGQPELFDKIMATQLANLKDGLFHNTNGSYNSVDAPLWFVNAIQQRTREPFADLFREANLPFSAAMMWEQYGAPIRHILDNFRQGTHYNIMMHENGLISQGADGIALTWMDAIDGNEAVTPRRGYAVEINALWYNAVCFALEAARAANDTDFVAAYAELPALIKASFVDQFWDNSRNYLADVVLDGHRDFAVRPNMVFAEIGRAHV